MEGKKENNMAITKFGEYARDLRIDRGENLKEMAKSLGVSSAFLSAVENGKKQVPKTWYERISSIYELALKEKEKLKNAIEESKKMLVLNLENATQANKEFALVFARSFEELTDEERKKIQGILTKKRGKKNA